MWPACRSVTSRPWRSRKHYSVEVLTCQPADPASKGGVESSVKIAKADLVPKDTNLRDAYASFAELEAACTAFMDQVNTREHRTTRRRPVDMLAEEAASLHRVPDTAHTLAYGVGRRVPENTPMVSFDNAQYSVPCPSARRRGVRPVPRDRPGRAGRDRARRRRRAGRGRPPRTRPARVPGDPGRTLPGPPGEGARRLQARAPVQGGSRVPGHRRRRAHLAARGRRGRGATDQREDGRGRRAGQDRRHRRGR